ncbi:MAG TPA: sugar phosphate nucleotidyltransferase [Kofleriaceae bacterium]|nr:sugar phosphate nucleotidyltransferase [Kofleriaceae bacterium]
MGHTYLLSRTAPVHSDAPTLEWTLALAGGDGLRLADYVERRFGRRIPKQYCCLLGRRSMLEHTLDRMLALAPASRTLAVIGQGHDAFALPQLEGRCDHVVRQRISRDTGVAIYVALAMIRSWNPNAIVTITPADHYVAPAERYIAQLRIARGIAAACRDTVVIVGAHPTEADPELGYITLGRPALGLPPAQRVARFVEKPSPIHAVELVRLGALWSTMVTCGTATALWDLLWTFDPEQAELFDSLVPLIGTPEQDDAIDQVYRACAPFNFSRDLLGIAPAQLLAVALDGVEWSDWGCSARIESVLEQRRSRALLPALVQPACEPGVAAR